MINHMQFDIKEEKVVRFKKAFVAWQKNLRMTYNIQQAFQLEGYFTIKVTSLGANLCLIEEEEEGEIQALINKDKDWIRKQFKEIIPCSSHDVDNDRLTWLRCCGVPCLAQTPSVFSSSHI